MLQFEFILQCVRFDELCVVVGVPGIDSRQRMGESTSRIGNKTVLIRSLRTSLCGRKADWPRAIGSPPAQNRFLGDPATLIHLPELAAVQHANWPKPPA